MAPKVTKTVTEATCEKEGKITYTATSKFDGKTYTDTKTVTTPATCTDEGKVQYTAKVANPDKPGSTFVTFKTVKTPIDLNGHAFDADENKWVWSDDHQSATLIKTCFLCGKEIPYEAKVTKQVTKEPTCTEQGEVVYTATAIVDSEFSEDTTKTDTKTVTLMDALGHDWQAPTFTWNADHTKATATFVCKRDKSHTKVVEAVVTSKVTKEPTASSNGEKTFTATVSLDGKTIQNRKRLL